MEKSRRDSQDSDEQVETGSLRKSIEQNQIMMLESADRDEDEETMANNDCTFGTIEK